MRSSSSGSTCEKHDNATPTRGLYESKALGKYLLVRDPAVFPKGGHATPKTFRTTETHLAVGAGGLLVLTSFDEEVLGGFDNSHDVALVIARSGSVVVTALVASNSQSGDAPATAAVATRLTTVALERAERRMA